LCLDDNEEELLNVSRFWQSLFNTEKFTATEVDCPWRRGFLGAWRWINFVICLRRDG